MFRGYKRACSLSQSHNMSDIGEKLLLQLELLDFRVLYPVDVDEILRFSTRDLSHRVWMVVTGPNYTAETRRLRPKEGLIIGHIDGDEGHTVSLFRAFDKYLYYDSLGYKMKKDVAKYLKRIGVNKNNLVIVGDRLQSEEFGTCAYHTLAFLDFALAYDHLSAKKIRKSFLHHYEDNADYNVVMCVEKIVQEMEGICDMSLKCPDPKESICNEVTNTESTYEIQPEARTVKKSKPNVKHTYRRRRSHRTRHCHTNMKKG